MLNPSTESPLAHIAAAAASDVDTAIKASSNALEGWKATSASTRAQLLLELARLIERDSDELASIEAIDAGILFEESKALHVPNAVDTLRFWANLIVTEPSGQAIDIPGGFAYTRREPYGVCAAIVPWNAPLMITIWKLAPCIAASNVLTIKTPELAPLYGQKLGQLIIEAGFPPGVINILCGFGHIAGKALAEHMAVRKISFTGSGPTGRSILRAASESNLKKVTLELGGKGPSLVFEDADFDNALFWTMIGSTANNGQVCALGSRIYVQASIYERFVEELRKRSMAQKTLFGDPLSHETTKGPIISRPQYMKIMGHIDRAKSEGAKVLFGGKQLGEGIFVENTILTDVTEDMTIVREEVFGPVAVSEPMSPIRG